MPRKKRIKIKRALISVSDKTGVVGFARNLQDMGVEILSTGGTAKTLRDNGVTVIDVSTYTGSPEMFDGRVKTLHPRIHGGILFRRKNKKDKKDAKKYDILPIDMVVCNLYPFQKTIEKPGVTFAEAIEQIDIGGPAQLRSASKNFEDVVPVVNPKDYNIIIFALKRLGDIDYETRRVLARKVFRHTSEYDKTIADYLGKHSR